MCSMDVSGTGSFSHDGRLHHSYDQSGHVDELSSTSQYHPLTYIDFFSLLMQFGEHVGESSFSSQSYLPQFMNFFPPPMQL